MKTGRAALDVNNPRHWSGHGLPGAYYMPDTPGPVQTPKRTPEQERAVVEMRAEFQRQKAAGTLPRVFPR